MGIANVEAAKAWDGHEGARWAEQADRYERTSERHRAHLVTPAIIGSGDRVLDVGCGAGLSTIEAARLASEGSALGLDLSSQMLARARERAAAEGIGNVTYEQGDAQVHPFDPGSADVAISLYGAMFFSDPVAAFANIGAGLRPSGRIALLAWRDLDRNEWLSTVRGALALGRDLPTPPPDAPTPFSLANPDRVRTLLTDAGFGDIHLDAVDEPADLGDDADDAFSWFQSVGIVEGLLEGVDDAGRAQGLDNLRAAFKEAETADGVLLGTSSWLITATRI